LGSGGCALSALKLALGDIGDFVFFDLALRDTTPADLCVRWIVRCRTDFSDYPRQHTHPTHTVRREARGHISVVIFATKTTFLCNSERTTLKRWPRLPLDTSLAGRVPQGGKVARTWYPRPEPHVSASPSPVCFFVGVYVLVPIWPGAPRPAWRPV
jgi:hypothetical protein